jgi:dynein heavy chain, axonemal
MDKIATDLANDILSKVPDAFDVKKAEKDYPISYTESMNTVLTQELARYNGLVICIK